MSRPVYLLRLAMVDAPSGTCASAVRLERRLKVPHRRLAVPAVVESALARAHPPPPMSPQRRSARVSEAKRDGQMAVPLPSQEHVSLAGLSIPVLRESTQTHSPRLFGHAASPAPSVSSRKPPQTKPISGLIFTFIES